MTAHEWQSAEIQKALLYGREVSQFPVLALVESIHMLFEQITLDDDSQRTIKLAAKMMLRLHAQ